ncbi:MAG: response regulator transcription factor [Methanocella sp.]
MRVLIVDDDPDIRALLRDYLLAEGYAVSEADDGRRALETFQSTAPDLVILDVTMPRLDGMEVCRRIRQGSAVPVMFLTARDDEVDQLLGFGFGADDYVTKPFSPRTVMARVKALLRRTAGAAPSPSGKLVFGDLEIDPAAFTARHGGQDLPLTVKEFQLLYYFARHAGRVLTKRQLVTGAWGEEYFGDDAVLMVHLSHLRHKLGGDAGASPLLRTVRGVGYKFAAEEAQR